MKNYPIEMDYKPKMKTDLFKRNENTIEYDARFEKNNKEPYVHFSFFTHTRACTRTICAYSVSHAQ